MSTVFNHSAGDIVYKLVKSFIEYRFVPIISYHAGLKLQYTVYTIMRRTNGCKRE